MRSFARDFREFWGVFWLKIFVIFGLKSRDFQEKSSANAGSVNNSERNCAHVSTFQTLVAQKIPKWRIFLCTRNKIQKLFPYELNLFF